MARVESLNDLKKYIRSNISKLNSRMRTSAKHRKQGLPVTQDYLYIQNELRKNSGTFGKYNKRLKVWEFQAPSRLGKSLARAKALMSKGIQAPTQTQYEKAIEKIGIPKKNYNAYAYAMQSLKEEYGNLGGTDETNQLALNFLEEKGKKKVTKEEIMEYVQDIYDKGLPQDVLEKVIKKDNVDWKSFG